MERLDMKRPSLEGWVEIAIYLQYKLNYNFGRDSINL